MKKTPELSKIIQLTWKKSDWFGVLTFVNSPAK